MVISTRRWPATLHASDARTFRKWAVTTGHPPQGIRLLVKLSVHCGSSTQTASMAYLLPAPQRNVPGWKSPLLTEKLTDQLPLESTCACPVGRVTSTGTV